MNKIDEASEAIKNTSEAAKNFLEIIDHIMQPKGIKLALIEGHKKIIEMHMERSDISEDEKIGFLSGYSEMVKKYKNRMKVVDIAVPLLSENARPEDIEEDWLSFFFDKVGLVSEITVQNMWGQILAGESNEPGTFQRSLLHKLSIMSKSQAELFCNVARFCMSEYRDEDAVHPFLFISSNIEPYKNSNISRIQLLELDNLGLIQCDFKDEFVFITPKIFRYGNKVVEVEGDPENQKKIKTGNVRFTLDGNSLYKIVGENFKTYRVDILEFTIARFRSRNCKVIINGNLVH